MAPRSRRSGRSLSGSRSVVRNPKRQTHRRNSSGYFYFKGFPPRIRDLLSFFSCSFSYSFLSSCLSVYLSSFLSFYLFRFFVSSFFFFFYFFFSFLFIFLSLWHQIYPLEGDRESYIPTIITPFPYNFP